MAVCSPATELALCAGAGGLTLGLKLALARLQTVCYVERDSYAAATLVARMEDQTLDRAPVWDDVATFDGRPWRGLVDLVSAGYPCQPFSSAGKRLASADPRHLWPHVARIVREVEPPVCFFENVANHLVLGFSDVRAELQAMGYRVAAGLYTAAEAGAPHERKRLFIVAVAPGRRRPQGRAEQRGRERRPPFVGGGESMADAGHQRPRPQPAQPVARSGHTSNDRACRAAVDDAPLRGDGAVPVRPGDEAGQAEPDRAGACLGDTGGDQRSQRGRGPEEPAQAWPPGPLDADGWERYLHDRTGFEPAVCRGLDGLAHRVDRLRLCGNGVVPVAAALAFMDLWTELMEEDNGS